MCRNDCGMKTKTIKLLSQPNLGPTPLSHAPLLMHQGGHCCTQQVVRLVAESSDQRSLLRKANSQKQDKITNAYTQGS